MRFAVVESTGLGEVSSLVQLYHHRRLLEDRLHALRDAGGEGGYLVQAINGLQARIDAHQTICKGAGRGR